MLRFIEGFELFDKPAIDVDVAPQFALKYQNVSISGPLQVFIGSGAVAPKAFGVSGYAQGAGLYSRWRTPNFTAQSTWVQGWRRYVPVGGLYGDSELLMRFIAPNGQVQVTLECWTESSASTSYGVRLWRGDPAIGGAVLISELANVVPCDLWQYLELRVTFSTTAGRLKLLLNGNTSTPLIDLIGQNTNPAGSGSAIAVEYSMRPNNGKVVRIDDMYLLDTSSPGASDFLGPRTIEGLRPTADGAGANEWTPSSGTNHAAMLDEVGLHDGDGTTLSTASLEKTEVFDVGSLAFITGDIDGVQLSVVARLSAGSSRNLKPAFRDAGGTTAFGSTFAVDSTSYRMLSPIMETSPVSAAAFTTTDIDSGEFGVKSVA